MYRNRNKLGRYSNGGVVGDGREDDLAGDRVGSDGDYADDQHIDIDGWIVPELDDSYLILSISINHS